METGDPELIEACRRLWESATARKMYITGGVGASRRGEAFGADYVLPNESAYAETCAAIGLVFLITSLMFRSAIAGVFCIIPVGIATMLNFSLMGLTAIPLGVTTALLSGMGIGIGVDYAIHFVARYRWLSQTEMDRAERIGNTRRACR